MDGGAMERHGGRRSSTYLELAGVTRTNASVKAVKGIDSPGSQLAPTGPDRE